MAIKKSSGLKYTDLVSAQSGMTRDAISRTAVDTTNRLYGGDINVRSQGGTFTPGSGGYAAPATNDGYKATTAPIAADALGASAPIQMPQPSTDTTGATAMAAGAEAGAKTIGDYLKEITPPETETSKQYNDILGSINNLLPELGNKKAEQAKVEKQLGIPDTRKQLAELNGLMTSRLAEYNKAIAETETAPGETPLGLVLGRQAVIRRNQAADLGLLQARGLALQGQLEAAQETANRAIDLKYGTMEDTINIKMQQLQLIQPILDKEERRYAVALERKYTEEQAALAEKKEQAKANVALAFTAGVASKFANKNGEFFRVSDGKPYSDPTEFFGDAGVSSFEEAYSRGVVTDVTAATLADREFVQNLRNTYPDAGIDSYDTAESAVNKLSGSNKYLIENTPEPVSTPKPITINGQDYFPTPEGTYIPASAFIEGETPDNNSKYISNNGGQLKLGVGAVDTLSGFDGTLQQADKAMSLINSGVKTGPVTGRFMKVNKLLGTESDKRMSLEQTLAQLKSDFQKALSGMTVSDKEAERLASFLPSITDQESVIKSKLANLKSSMGVKKNVFLETLGGQQNPNFNSQNQVKGVKQSVAPLPYMSVGATPTKSGAPLLQTIVNKTYPPGSIGGQCGDFVRKVVNKLGATYPALGDSLKSKMAAVQKYGTSAANGRIGSVIVTKENPTYGHVAYIIGRNAQGWIVGESNFKQSNRVSYGRVIPFNSPKIVGVINPTKNA